MLFKSVLNFIIFVSAVILQVGAECCGKGHCVRANGHDCDHWECNDGTEVGVTECCGYGECNIFCCNCDARPDGRVCRVRRSLRSLAIDEDPDDATIFASVNKSGTGKMTLEEFLAYFGHTKRSVEDSDGLVQKFQQYDRDGDGSLTVEEMKLPKDGQTWA